MRTGDHVSKQRAAVQRDVGRLLDDLAPERPPARHDSPAPTVRRFRSPGRCILQATTRAVSVSWFPGQLGDDSLGELVITVWRGVVAQPGSAQRLHTSAEPLETLALHPVALPTGEWQWYAGGTPAAVGVAALAAKCWSLLDG